MSNRPIASIMIIVKDDPGVAETLALTVPQAQSVGAQLIVVDASAPSTLAHIRQEYPDVVWEYFKQHGKHITIPEQRNRALELATGKYLIFLDSSCQPVEGWLTAILENLEAGEDIVCGPVHDTNAKNLVRYIPGRAEKGYVDDCTTVSVGLTRAVIAKITGFDTNLAYGEDVDFFWRAKDAGFAICSDPRVAVSHDWGPTDEQFRRAFRYGRSRAIIHKKHIKRRWRQLLLKEPHVWIYPLYIVGLPIAIVWPWYLLFLAVPLLKNRSFTLIIHHLVFGWGVLVGVFTPLGSKQDH
ncbi:glycosyltransferase [bacterium]|nr:MAG: glycosyltransferase [bacterium]